MIACNYQCPAVRTYLVDPHISDTDINATPSTLLVFSSPIWRHAFADIILFRYFSPVPSRDGFAATHCASDKKHSNDYHHLPNTPCTTAWCSLCFLISSTLVFCNSPFSLTNELTFFMRGFTDTVFNITITASSNTFRSTFSLKLCRR